MNAAVAESAVDGDARGDLTLFGNQLQLYIGTSDRKLRRRLLGEMEPSLVFIENEPSGPCCATATSSGGWAARNS